MLPKTVIVLGLSALAAAQSATSSAAPVASGATTVISVSNKDGQLEFRPDSVRAEQGAFVEFRFWPRNHSVAESAFGSPCSPLTSSRPLFSGFHPVAADAQTRPSWKVQINSTSPIWLYCSQGKHCQSGMVAVINPPSSNSRTLAAYKAAAADASRNVSPQAVFGGVVGTAGGSSSASPSSTGSSSGSGASASSTPSSSPASSSPSASTKPSAGVANTARLSVVAAVAVLVGGIACFA